MTSLPLVTLDDVLKYATRENLFYLIGGLVFLKIGEWSYVPIRKLFSPLRHLAGPKNEHLIFGNLKRIFGAQNSVLHEQWVGEYGLTFVYRGFLSVCLLLPPYRLPSQLTSALPVISIVYS